jgi:hypothetical protein
VKRLRVVVLAGLVLLCLLASAVGAVESQESGPGRALEVFVRGDGSKNRIRLLIRYRDGSTATDASMVLRSISTAS